MSIKKSQHVKLSAHKGGASRKGNLIYIVPLDPKAGLAGHLPVKPI
jgi:hypothetical protein